MNADWVKAWGEFVFERILYVSLFIILLWVIRKTFSSRISISTWMFVWLCVGLQLLIPIRLHVEVPPTLSLQVGDLSSALIVTWLLVATVLAILLIVNYRKHYKPFLRLRSNTQSHYLETLENLKEDISLYQPISLHFHNNISVPTVCGFLHAKILLPSPSFESLESERQHEILTHELWHVKKRDLLLNLLATFLVILHWFNPLIWIAYRWFKEDQEMQCDQHVLRRKSEEERRHYAETLLQFAKASNLPKGILPTVSLSENFFSLRRRIQSITQIKKTSMIQNSLLIAASLIFTLTAFAKFEPAASEQSEQATASGLRWLALYDKEDFKACWKTGHSILTTAITEKDWANALQSVSQQTGAINKRTIISTKYHKQLPNIASQHHYELVLEGDFLNGFTSQETVYLSLDDDHNWKVSGYWVRPAEK